MSCWICYVLEYNDELVYHVILLLLLVIFSYVVYQNFPCCIYTIK